MLKGINSFIKSVHNTFRENKLQNNMFSVIIYHVYLTFT